MNTDLLVVLFVLVLAVVVGVVVIVLSRQTSRPADDPPHQGPQHTTIGQSGMPEGPQPILVVVGGVEAGRRVPIDVAPFNIGRVPDNQLMVPGELVSRFHSVIAFEGGRYVLYDRESTNGTYVNGRRISRHVLATGDVIQIGPLQLRFQPPGTPPAAFPANPTPPIEREQPASAAVAIQLPELPGYVFSLHRQTSSAFIFKAVSPDGRMLRAVKVLRKADPYIRQRFSGEISFLASFRHPNIVAVYGSGLVNGNPYYIMEFCEQGSLRDRMTPGRPLSVDFVVPVIGQTCEALSYAHARKVIHRDIKPENILFAANGQVKVVDFGIAKLAGQLTLTVQGMVIGTPAYLPYEQAKGLDVDERSDVYSLGIVLYELFAGRKPFEGETLDVIHQHLTKTPVMVRQWNPQLAPALEQVVLKAMQKDRRLRFGSAKELADALGYGPSKHEAARPAQAPAPQQGEPISVASALAVNQVAGKRPSHCLRIMSGPRAGQTIFLREGGNVLGRQAIDPSDLGISRQQAQVWLQNGAIWLDNLSGTYGTIINNQRVFGRVGLREGDAVQMGTTLLRVDRGA